MLGRNAREAYLSAYEDAASQSVEHLAFFEALKFTERMVTIAQWLQSGFEIPIRKISQESLRGSYKVHIVNVYARLKEVTGCTQVTTRAEKNAPAARPASAKRAASAAARS